MALAICVLVVYACSMALVWLMFDAMRSVVYRLEQRISRLESIVFGEGWNKEEYWTAEDWSDEDESAE